MMQKMLIALYFSTLFLAACGGVVQPTASPTPQPVDGLASVETVDLLMLESFPLQVGAIAHGTLPDICTKINQVKQVRSGNDFKVTITTHSEQGADCPATELLNRFDETFALDVYGLAAGTYTVSVNGVTTSFTFESDNILPDAPNPDSTPGGGMAIGIAPVESVSVDVISPANIRIVIHGYFPDGCTSLNTISEALAGSVVRLTVETQRPAEATCTQAIVEFQETYTLVTQLSRGTYTLVVNDFSTQFTIP